MLLGNALTPIALDRAGLTLEDLDLIEIHEAFAAQVLSNLKCLMTSSSKRNSVERSP